MSSTVRRVGKWEVEKSRTENKIFISDLSGKLLAEFDVNDHLNLIAWTQEHSKGESNA